MSCTIKELSFGRAFGLRTLGLLGLVGSGWLCVGAQVAYAQQTPPPLPSQISPQADVRESNGSRLGLSQQNRDAAIAVGREYLLGAGDVLRMEIFNLADYSRDYQVGADGYLTLPLIGSVFVQDMTLEQLRYEVSSRYQRYIRQPVITFEMRETRPLQVTIVGEVNRPGAYTIAMADQPGGNGMAPPTLTQVIQLAEGITQSADIRRVEVLRYSPNTPATPSVFRVSLWDLLTSGDVNADVVLQDGDSVRIPTATAVDAGEAATLASASFSPDEMGVYVVGEVDSPGRVSIPPNTPLNQALLAAGGFSERAQTASVELVRLNPNGTVSQRDINIDLAADVSADNNPLLQENDTIVVRRSGASAFADTVGNFVSPFNLLVNIFRAIGGN